jgi:hypothetical protein
MNKKNLIYIVGGAAVIGYFLYMKKKSSQKMIVEETPDQALAPAFVNDTTNVIKKVANTVKALRSGARSMRKTSPQAIDENSGMVSPTSESIFSSSSPLEQIKSMLTAKEARSQGKAAAQSIVSAGGSKRQGRQAARVVKRDARSARKMGELSVTF